MLTDPQKLAFLLHTRAFFYTPPLPLRLNKEQTRLVISRSPVTWTLWMVQILNVCFHLILYSFAMVKYGWLSRRPDFTWLNTLMIFFGVFVLFVYTSEVYTWIRQGNVIIGAANNLLQISTNLFALAGAQNSKLKYNRASVKYAIFDWAIIGFVISGATLPFVFVLGAFYTDYDALNFILDDTIPVPKMYRSQETLYLVILLRAGSVFVTWLEVSRSGTYFGCCILTVIDHVMHIVRLLLNNFITDSNLFTGVFTQIQIIQAMVKEWSEGLILLVTLVSFWGTVAASWFSIRCFGLVDWMVYYISVIITVIFVLINFVLIPALVQVSLSIMQVAKTHYKVISLVQGFSKRKSERTLYYLKKAKALKPIVFWYGSFCIIDQDFLLDHLWMLISRTVDAILIVDVSNFLG